MTWIPKSWGEEMLFSFWISSIFVIVSSNIQFIGKWYHTLITKNKMSA